MTAPFVTYLSAAGFALAARVWGLGENGQIACGLIGIAIILIIDEVWA